MGKVKNHSAELMEKLNTDIIIHRKSDFKLEETLEKLQD